MKDRKRSTIRETQKDIQSKKETKRNKIPKRQRETNRQTNKVRKKQRKREGVIERMIIFRQPNKQSLIWVLSLTPIRTSVFRNVQQNDVSCKNIYSIAPQVWQKQILIEKRILSNVGKF